ncbi:hypothetical protein C7271_02610 [filamentous cyanobacterium CCP5]|nr:hypothetical protein C7271_02610 [filamentous cyanobacterium CCP5]
MTAIQQYVLVVDSSYEDFQDIRSLLSGLPCPVFVAGSTEQAVAQTQQGQPYLVILAGDRDNWSQPLVHRLRQMTQRTNVTIVALTDTADPLWGESEDNPDIDGFLVKPVSGDVLNLLVESALAKQAQSVSQAR